MTEQNSKPFWGRKTFCLVTGASQGIGRQIAVDFAKNVAAESTFLLLARNLDKLDETKALIEGNGCNVNVLTHSFNFSEPIGVELHKLINLSLSVFKQEASEFELALIVHNAGSLGDVTESVVEMRNLEKIESYFVLNLYSVIILNAEFVKTFEVAAESTELAFLNITSLCGRKPFASMGYYCMGKSAREMYFGVLAEENKQFTVLSYSPGPVITEMTDNLVTNIPEGDVKDMFLNMRNESKMLTTEVTIRRLVEILEKRAFQNGSIKDFFDSD